MFLAALEDDVRVVDEQDGWCVALRGLEHRIDLLVETVFAGDQRSIDHKELALQPVGQGRSNRRLACARRSGQKDAAFGLQVQLGRQGLVLERQDDMGLQALNHLLDALQIPQIDRLHLGQVHVAHQVLRAQILDEAPRVQTGDPA